MRVLDPPNMIVLMTNVIFFIIVQTLFFKFEASKQFETVLEDKVDILNEYLKYDPSSRDKMKQYLESPNAQQLAITAKIMAQQREQENLNLIKKWVGIPLIIAVLAMIYFVHQLKTQSMIKWHGVDTVMMTLVVLAYVGELLFYFGIVARYQFYGDHKIYNTMYDNIKNKLNIDQVDEKIDAVKQVYNNLQQQ